MNTKWFDNVIKEIDNINTCDQLASASLKISTKVSSIETSISSEISSLSGLTTPPTDLVSAIKWITDFIQTYLGPEVVLVADTAIVIAKIAEITVAAAAKAAELGCNKLT